MGLRNIRKLWAILILSVVFCYMNLSTVWAEDIFSMRLSGAKANLPEIKVYMNLLDEDDNPIDNISMNKDNLNASVGEYAACVEEITAFKNSGEGTAYIFAVDISKSLSNKEFEQIRKLLTTFSDKMNTDDMVSIITFGEEVKVIQEYSSNRDMIKKKIKGLAPTDNKTQFYRGVEKAVEIGESIDSKIPDRRIIILISDGQDDYIGGVTKAEILEKMKVDRIPIYSIGFYKNSLDSKKQEYLNILGEFARMSGGEYFQTGIDELSEIYSTVNDKLMNSFILKLSCEECKPDGRVYHVHVTLTEGSRKMNDGLDIRITSANVSEDVLNNNENETVDVINQNDSEENINADNKNYIDNGKDNNGQGKGYESSSEEKESKTSLRDKFNKNKKVLIPSIIGVIIILALIIIIVLKKKPSQTSQENIQSMKGSYYSDSRENNDNRNNIQIKNNQSIDVKTIMGEEILKTSALKKQSKSQGSLIQEDRISDNKKIEVIFTVVGTTGDEENYKLIIKDSIIVGRTQSHSDFTLNDPEVSSKHCELMYKNRGLYIKDLNSLNGTYVNGVPLNTVRKLQNGDLIYIGGTELRITFKLE